MSDVRDALASEIRRKGIKQRDIAEKVGVTVQKISDTLCKRRGLDANEFLAICTAIDVSADFFQKKIAASDKS